MSSAASREPTRRSRKARKRRWFSTSVFTTSALSARATVSGGPEASKDSVIDSPVEGKRTPGRGAPGPPMLLRAAAEAARAARPALAGRSRFALVPGFGGVATALDRAVQADFVRGVHDLLRVRAPAPSAIRRGLAAPSTL